VLLNNGEQNLHGYVVGPVSKHALVAFLKENLVKPVKLGSDKLEQDLSDINCDLYVDNTCN
jgi:hypothetical protein